MISGYLQGKLEKLASMRQPVFFGIEPAVKDLAEEVIGNLYELAEQETDLDGG